MLLRKAEGLVSQRISPHRVRRALKKLRERFTDAQPLTGVSLGTDGPQVVVHERGARWQAESGQVLLQFERTEPGLGDTPMVALPTSRSAFTRAVRPMMSCSEQVMAPSNSPWMTNVPSTRIVPLIDTPSPMTLPVFFSRSTGLTVGWV